MSIKQKPFSWLKENLPYHPCKVGNLPDGQLSDSHENTNELPFKQVVNPNLSTSFYRFLPSEEGNSVFINTHQAEGRMKEFFEIIED